jgi:LmbE family N-acetylglucosaminyl deacetylase
MFNSKIKNTLAGYFRKKFKAKSTAYNTSDLGKSALIIAPHFDDETLGCGGIIAKKKLADASIKIVFMTDGTQSHSKHTEKEKLSLQRREEAYKACGELGINRDDIIVLDFTDSLLEKGITEAELKLKEIVEDFKPNEFFIPSEKEPWIFSGDHIATTRICINVLKDYKDEITIYEYPIWYWYSYPWVSLPFKLKKTTISIFRHSMNGIWGMGLLRHFNCYVELDGVKELKRNALDQHESQMKSQNSKEQWNTLAGVSNGEFLNCFFYEYEVFNKRIITKS